MHIFLFIAAILLMIGTPAFVHIMCKHVCLVTGIAFQPIKVTDAIFSSISDNENCACKAQWYTIVALT